MREFRRSARFGVIGVFVVAAIVVVIALSADSTDPNPKLQLGLIFGVIAAFIAVLLFLQRADIDRAATGDVRGFGGEPRSVDDPTKFEDGELWSALAVRPIDTEAIDARREMWDVGRRGVGLAAVICVLIFLTVPAIYLTESFVPLIIGGPLIAIAAIYGAVRAIGPGGDVDRGYERATGGAWNASSGRSDGWEPWTVDLSAYAGQQVEISISYVSDWGTQGVGAFVDDIQVSNGDGTTSFEEDADPMDGWDIPGPQPGSANNPNDWTRTESVGFQEGAVSATDDTLYFGFGFEGIDDAATRADVLARSLAYLLH